MKKQLLVLISIMSIAISAAAQKEYKLAKTSGHLNLNIPGAIIEGYAGNEIIFSTPKSKVEVVDERAKGLKMISGSGFTDNTGLGLDVSEKGDEVNVNAVGKGSDMILTIKVPQNMKVSFNNTSNIYQSEVILKNLKNEIDVSASWNKIKLENNTGPMNIKTLQGSVDAVFSGEIKGPVSIVSVYGYVDVTLPGAVKADVELSTGYGKLYAAEGLKIAIDKNVDEKSQNRPTINFNGTANLTGVTTIRSGRDRDGLYIADFGSSGRSENIKGKINGGGAAIILKSTHKNVYLRDK